MKATVTSAPGWASNENVWVVAVGFLGFIGALIAARAAWRAVHPRLCLKVYASKSLPLLDDRYDWDDVVISHRGQALRSDPSVRLVEVTNMGRRDVPIENDGDLSIDLSADIVEVIAMFTRGRRSNRNVPDAGFSGSELALKKGHIPGRYLVRYVVLLKGPRPGFEVRSSLPNVRIKERRSDGARLRRWSKIVIALAVFFVLGIWFGSA
ncbi:hypothetical protein [Streptomyces sp. NPDC059402]|uniref:hypothetical protein n=1 Tax=Streptomyces sp. NPDC059402 TaxID=3346822 RepID=UPI0036907D9D